MDWFLQNWVWVLFAAGMVAMHMFGHGGHGGHAGHGGHRGHGGGSHRDDPKPATKDSEQRNSEQGPGHQH